MKDIERLEKVYSKTDGYCHICHKKLSFANYGKYGAKGAWHIEHSIAKANGGTDHLNNLYPACISCNLAKGVLDTKVARNYYGQTRAPYSKEKKQKIKTQNTVNGAIGGAIVGSVFGPVGILIGTIAGAAIGENNSPKK